MLAYPPEIPLTTALATLADTDEFLKRFKSLLDSRMLSNRGSLVLQFEKEISAALGGQRLHAVTCSNATLGAELVFRAFRLKGKVLVTPFTFVATVHAIVNSGLEPVFVDIDPDSLCLSPKEVEKHLTPDVCAVFPVHVYGNICDLEYFESLRARGIRVIYDSAHAFGVKKDGVPVAGWGDAEIYSFHATKIINAVEGGAVVSRDPDFIRKITLMTNFGFTGETNIELIGTNAKLSEIHALFGLISLGDLGQSIAVRNRVSAQYREELEGIRGLSFLKKQERVESNGQYFPVFLEDQSARDGLYEFLKKDRILARKYFYPLVNQFSPYREKYGVPFPVADSASSRVLCLPIHNLLAKEHVTFISGRIRSFLES